jgi:hypothetical protein
VDATSSKVEDGCPLSIHRAFVVRLYADHDPARERIGGQVEHVVSGEGAEFRSLEELVQFMSRVLKQRQSRADEA